jgi:hypothetical protein
MGAFLAPRARRAIVKQLAFVLLLLSTSAWAQWTFVEGSDDFDAYIDAATIRKKGNTVKMWVLREYGAVQRIGKKVFLSMKIQEEYDCGEEQSRVLYVAWYSGSTGSGEVLTTLAQATRWQPIAPGTVGEALWNVACKH